MSFVAVLLLLAATILAVYLVCALVGPGVFGGFGGRALALRYLLDAIYIALVATVVLQTHRNLVSPGLQPFRSTRAGGHRRSGGVST